ncbi:MAG: pyridoxamine 5'-phosphate oxidase family protein [Paracoccaceae bacterium]
MIRDAETLRALYGPVNERAAKKVIDRLDRHCLDFLAASPFMLLATTDGVRVDVSPKGDAPGFVQADGERAILIPDWPGNARIDGLTNVLAHPRVGTIFMIPNVRETLRINGPAEIHDDEAMRARFETRGRLPITVLRVETEEVFTHCSKAMMRSHLWRPETWPQERPVAGLYDIIKDHAAMPVPEITEAEMLERFERQLY